MNSSKSKSSKSAKLPPLGVSPLQQRQPSRLTPTEEQNILRQAEEIRAKQQQTIKDRERQRMREKHPERCKIESNLTAKLEEYIANKDAIVAAKVIEFERQARANLERDINEYRATKVHTDFSRELRLVRGHIHGSGMYSGCQHYLHEIRYDWRDASYVCSKCANNLNNPDIWLLMQSWVGKSEADPTGRPDIAK